MKKIIFSLLFILSLNNSYATPQTADLLISNGDTIPIYPFIVEQYLKINPAKGQAFRDYLLETFPKSTAHLRGYQAMFELKNDSLFLLKIFSGTTDKYAINLDILFNKKDKIFADWYSGEITNPENCLMPDYGNKWGGFYEYETDFTFEKGVLKSIVKYKNEAKFSEYTESDKLIDYIASNMNYTNIKALDYDVKVMVKIDDVDKNGRITKASVLKSYNDEYDTEAIRIIQSIPQWEVWIRRGKVQHKPYIIPVIFSVDR